MQHEPYVPFTPTLTEENAEFAAVKLLGHFYKLSTENQQPFAVGAAITEVKPLYLVNFPQPEGWGEKMREQYKGIPLEHQKACHNLMQTMKDKAGIPKSAFICIGGGEDAAIHNFMLNKGAQWAFQRVDCYMAE